MEYLIWVIIFVVFIIAPSIKQIDQYERGIKITLGKFTKIMQPGWNLVIPVFQSYKKVDIRTKVVDVQIKKQLLKITFQ